MPQSTHRAARIATAVTFAAALALGTSACSFATLDGVAPGAGANATANNAYVLNAVLVGAGSQARVVASVQTQTDDTLVSIGGTPLKPNGDAGTAYNTATVNLTTKAGVLYNLDGKSISLTSPDSQPGDSAKLTFTFAKAGAITVDATITSSSNPDYQPSSSASQG